MVVNRGMLGPSISLIEIAVTFFLSKKEEIRKLFAFSSPPSEGCVETPVRKDKLF